MTMPLGSLTGLVAPPIGTFSIGSGSSSSTSRKKFGRKGSVGSVQLHSRGVSLYGRSRELELLQGALGRVLSQEKDPKGVANPPKKAEVVLVHGESGSGKSALVRNFRNTVRTKDGNTAFFIEGKFDQNTESSLPYSAIVDAVTQLCNSIVESDYLDEIKKAIETTLSAEISVLSRLVPAMKVLTKDLEAKEDSNTGRKTNNYGFKLFTDTFRSFFRVVCDTHPVVLFLDDVQWADEADRKLVAAITTDAGVQNSLFIAAFRDDELETSSVLSWVAASSDTRTVVDIAVGPLCGSSVNEMIAAMTDLRLEQTKALSELVSRKTGRNAYFVTQYMEDLQREELLSFSFKSSRWEWDLEEIESSTDVSDNVVGLLTKQITSLPIDVQQVLMVAACLGFVVNVDALEQIVLAEGLLTSITSNNEAANVDEVDKPAKQTELWIFPDDAALAATEEGASPTNSDDNVVGVDEAQESKRYRKAFRRALRVGLVEKTTGGKYKFSHDRVQQAAYSLMPPGEEGAALHIRLGDVLLQMSATEDGEEWMFFAGVDLLSKFVSHLSGTDSRVRLARLSLEAGIIAENKSAFMPATQYLKTGIEQLDPVDRWTTHYDLCLELHTKAAELGRTYDDFNSTLALVEETVTHGRCFQDKLRVLSTKAFVLGGQDKLPEAIKACMVVLRELGVRMPSNPSTLNVLTEYAKTKLLLKGRNAREILKSLHSMTDDAHIEAMHFLNAAAIFAWHADLESVASFVFLRMMRLTLKHGLCRYSPFAFATFGMLLAAIGDFKEGYEFGRVALEMLDTVEGSRICFAATKVVVESCLTHLQKPLYESLAPLLESHEVGMQTGEIEFAALCLSGHGGMSIILGARLESMEEALSNYVPFFRAYGQGMAEGLSAPWLQFTMNMQGQALDPLVLTGDGMNEEEFLKHHTAGNHMMAVKNLHLVKMVLLYIFGELEAADESRAIWEAGTGAEGTHFMVYFAMLFSGLTSLGLARKYPKKRKFYTRRVRKHIKKLEKLVKNGALNATLILRFLRAEKLSLKADPQEAKEAFDDTINIAARTGSRLIKAIACERVGFFMLERRVPAAAADYLQQAFAQYADYGATAKVEQTEKHFNLLNFARPIAGMSIARGGTSVQLQPKAAATDIHRKINFAAGSVTGSGSFRVAAGGASTSTGGGSARLVGRRQSSTGSLSSALSSGSFTAGRRNSQQSTATSIDSSLQSSSGRSPRQSFRSRSITITEEH